ncbi:HAD-IC family P-type ATPase, partial [Enterococcus faecium]|uniref:HAD-IC family P-type ATPase n=1 Tax=Enterococcus faecium TaxID=1352 RepID=UPI003CC678C9
NYDAYVDLSQITVVMEVREAALRFSVFGRVSPLQKKLLVNELKESGRSVAMTGDGVNDVLALSEADCSIAMAEGDGATR